MITNLWVSTFRIVVSSGSVIIMFLSWLIVFISYSTLASHFLSCSSSCTCASKLWDHILFWCRVWTKLFLFCSILKWRYSSKGLWQSTLFNSQYLSGEFMKCFISQNIMLTNDNIFFLLIWSVHSVTLAHNEIPQSSICQIPFSCQVIMGYTWLFNIHNHVSLWHFQKVPNHSLWWHPVQAMHNNLFLCHQ